MHLLLCVDPDVTPSDASASAATMIVFALFIAVLSAEISKCLKNEREW